MKKGEVLTNFLVTELVTHTNIEGCVQ